MNWMHAELRNVTLNSAADDELHWSLNSKKFFTVKSTYDSLANQDIAIPVHDIFKFICSLKVPPKIGDMLRRRGIEVPQTRVFCSENETTDHLFIHYVFVKKIWTYFIEKLRWFFTLTPDVVTLLFSWTLPQDDKIQTQIWSIIPAAILWCIWNERNNKFFNGKQNSDKTVIGKAQHEMFCWCLVFKECQNLNYSDIIDNWPRAFLNPS
ncbi:uncharacterized protein LOC113343992 [Papaver somniferum]|uniref:uncharacterized protein LOC113343992 n=1 Tax=Papaver somniferum TaxID=3469 RepID=UPI000E6F987E|nr:uncharacterized protein LOC113343992 [Papaver somniferum]